MTTLMWEVRAAAGRLDELVAYADQHADPSALIFRAGESDPRVVVIDPSGQGLPDVPSELVARPPHAWPFAPVDRNVARNAD
ncbi:MAG TPA: hypothetical protein VFE19_06085 [Jatrophihabitantaceae bacterium]|jgi:hypothetical protein|nr:hypothetical protein [Jatrophihabitantaceae bacterium]